MNKMAVAGVLAMVMLSCACIMLAVENRSLRSELSRRPVQRPRIEVAPYEGGERPSPKRPGRRGAPEEVLVAPMGGRMPPFAGMPPPPPDVDDVEDALLDCDTLEEAKARIAEARKKRLEALKAMSPEEKARKRDDFLEKRRESAADRKRTFIVNTGLDETQAEAFLSTMASLDEMLQERTASWAKSIGESRSFTVEDQIRFVSDMTAVIDTGYEMMDSCLPSTWREDDGDFNLMQILGDEAFAPVVDALSEADLADGLRVIEMLMGGPGSAGEGGGGGVAPGEDGAMQDDDLGGSSAGSADGAAPALGGDAPGQMGLQPGR